MFTNMVDTNVRRSTGGNVHTSQRINVHARELLHDNGLVKLNSKKEENYLQGNYPDWQTAFHMVPHTFNISEGQRDQGQIAGDDGERRVYRLLHDLGNALGEPMFVIHSFKFKESGISGETDFLIISRKHGIIIMEVKAVEGHNFPDKIKKAKDQIKNISTYLKDQFPSALSNNMAFVMMPNCPRPEDSKGVKSEDSEDARPEDSKDAKSEEFINLYKNVCFKQDCQDGASFRKWWNENIESSRPPVTGIPEYLYKGLLCRLVLHRSTKKPLGKQVDGITRGVLQMFDKQQLALLDHFVLPGHLLITGPAGSGKTEILLHKVQALDADISKNKKNETILVLCYNRPLQKRLVKDLEKCSSVTVETWGTFKHKENATFDHIFVDEGQDVADNWLEVLKDIQPKPECKFHWVFFDNEQLVNIGGTEKEVCNTFRLRKVYRMTRRIFDQFKKYFMDPGEETQCSLGHDVEGLRIEWDKMDEQKNPADTKVACEYISKHVNFLLKSEVCGKDICVLVRDKEDVADPVMKELKSMEIQCQNAEDSITKPVNSAIIVDSIRRFKGLETKVLILYNPPDPRDETARGLLNTALSRCFCLLIIIAPEQVVESLQSDDGGTPRKSPTKPRRSLSPRKTDLVEAVRALDERFTPDKLSGLPVSSVNSIQEMLNRMSMVVSEQQKSQTQHKRSKSF